MTWSDRLVQLTLGVRSIAGIPQLAQPSGPQPGWQVPDEHRCPVHCSRHRGLTREACALDLREFTTRYRTRSLTLFAVRRADIEGFTRDLKVRGRARVTVTRRLCTIAGLYKYAVKEELLHHSQPSTCGGRGWTTSPMPPPWTATSSARCWWPPGSGLPSTR